MQHTTLAVMAAGIGSRFGGGIKQLQPVGPGGEIIIDYSIHDALEAGFDKVVFIIRKDLEKDFRAVIGDRIAKKTDVAYAFQELDDLPAGFTKPEGRTKPWGTGQAILAAKDVIHEPFAVINADDYYGKEPYVLMHDYLTREGAATAGKERISMCAFRLGNTLSDNGGVTRGVCRTDGNGHLLGVQETKNVVRTAEGAAVQTEQGLVAIDPDTPVSMNMWGLQPSFIDLLQTGFVEFLQGQEAGDLKGEYLLPIYIDQLLQAGRARVDVLPTQAAWFGVTYQEDKATVQQAFAQLTAQGVYPKYLL